jgi:hypothetical protein
LKQPHCFDKTELDDRLDPAVYFFFSVEVAGWVSAAAAFGNSFALIATMFFSAVVMQLFMAVVKLYSQQGMPVDARCGTFTDDRDGHVCQMRKGILIMNTP